MDLTTYIASAYAVSQIGSVWSTVLTVLMVPIMVIKPLITVIHILQYQSRAEMSLILGLHHQSRWTPRETLIKDRMVFIARLIVIIYRRELDSVRRQGAVE